MTNVISMGASVADTDTLYALRFPVRWSQRGFEYSEFYTDRADAERARQYPPNGATDHGELVEVKIKPVKS